MSQIDMKSKKEGPTDDQFFPSIDELLAEFPAEFEAELVELERPESPSENLLTETYQKMVQVNNLQQYEQQQMQTHQKNSDSLEDRLLDFLFPLTLLVSGIMVVGFGLVIYLIAPAFPLKQVTMSLFVMVGCGLLVLVSIIRWKQKQVKQRSGEK